MGCRFSLINLDFFILNKSFFICMYLCSSVSKFSNSQSFTLSAFDLWAISYELWAITAFQLFIKFLKMRHMDERFLLSVRPRWRPALRILRWGTLPPQWKRPSIPGPSTSLLPILTPVGKIMPTAGMSSYPMAQWFCPIPMIPSRACCSIRTKPNNPSPVPNQISWSLRRLRP